MHLTRGSWDEDFVGRNMAGFTALNGSDPKGSDAPREGPVATSAASEERPILQMASQETKTIEPTSGPREHWSVTGGDRQPYQDTSYPDVQGAHKRKRSESVEQQREASSAREREPLPPVESREVYTPHRERNPRQYTEDGREHHDLWYSQQSRDDRSPYETQDSAGPVAPQTEEQIGDAYRRGTSHLESQMATPTSPDDDESPLLYTSAYTQEQRRDGVLVQSDPKKRKRNFSNRTKTGCLTCRKRKKKCDETKPECTNCVRGGFICQGYPNQRGFPKSESKAAAVPLESKDPSYVPPGAYGMPQPSHYPNPPPAPPKRDSVPPYRGQPLLRIQTPQPPLPGTDDDHRQVDPTIILTASTPPEDKMPSHSAISKSSMQYPTPISAVSSTMQLQTPLSGLERPKDYQRVPPLHDHTRTEPETPQASTPRTQINILHHTRPHSPPPPPPPSQPATNPQMAAQLALSHSTAGRPPKTQKEEMLSGHQYYPFDPELVLERQRCSAACWRFNNSTNPNNGVSVAERSRLFREILNPREPINISPTMVSPVTNVGRVGQEVVVEAPFTCDYGYNITIGDHVFIGRNCTVLDPMEISVGDNSYIGPNVSLFGATLFTDPKKRQGSKSPQFGGPIVIGEDVWIGGGAIILPDVRIGRGSTVTAGSVVTHNVPPFTVVSGNPAHVIRGANS